MKFKIGDVFQINDREFRISETQTHRAGNEEYFLQYIDTEYITEIDVMWFDNLGIEPVLPKIKLKDIDINELKLPCKAECPNEESMSRVDDPIIILSVFVDKRKLNIVYRYLGENTYHCNDYEIFISHHGEKHIKEKKEI